MFGHRQKMETKDLLIPFALFVYFLSETWISYVYLNILYRIKLKQQIKHFDLF